VISIPILFSPVVNRFSIAFVLRVLAEYLTRQWGS